MNVREDSASKNPCVVTILNLAVVMDEASEFETATPNQVQVVRGHSPERYMYLFAETVAAEEDIDNGVTCRALITPERDVVTGPAVIVRVAEEQTNVPDAEAANVLIAEDPKGLEADTDNCVETGDNETKEVNISDLLGFDFKVACNMAKSFKLNREQVVRGHSPERYMYLFAETVAAEEGVTCRALITPERDVVTGPAVIVRVAEEQTNVPDAEAANVLIAEDPKGLEADTDNCVETGDNETGEVNVTDLLGLDG